MPTKQDLLDKVTAWPQAPTKWKLSHWSQLIPAVVALEPELQAQSDEEIRKRSLSLRYRAKSHEPLEQLLPEAFALVREAGRRTLNMRHFDVQMLGGIAMHNRSIAEMQTGEGKTLTATLPMYLHRPGRQGCHLATVNDYLARRDADWMRPIYEALGVTVGVIETQMQQPERREAYACDVTYGTAKEFGFDFLRDRLLLRRISEGQTDFLGGMLGITARRRTKSRCSERPYFVLVDEADSILIDEARTPLIISALPTEEERIAAECYRWGAAVAERIRRGRALRIRPRQTNGRADRRRPPAGAHAAQAGRDGRGRHVHDLRIHRAGDQGRPRFILDRHYVVRDGEIVIVDEFTGRMAEGRKWRDGIHQAVEAKEKVEVTVATGQAAADHRAGFLSALSTAGGHDRHGQQLGRRTAARSTSCSVCRFRPIGRPFASDCPTRVFGTADAKWEAIVEEVAEMHATGRPILIGTRSIDKSELLSQLLRRKPASSTRCSTPTRSPKKPRSSPTPASSGKVTVSTNMAGRGTDIKLGEGVADLGGLHVICHRNARLRPASTAN